MDIVNSICAALGHEPTSIAKKPTRRGEKEFPELTWYEIVRRLITYSTAVEAFPEFGKSTVQQILRKRIPEKINEKQKWRQFLLSLVSSKYCSGCGEYKSLDSFTTDKHNLDGLKIRCKSCVAEYTESTKEAFKEYSAQYYQEHKADYKARKLQYYDRQRVATPSWADTEAMNIFYANCPSGYHVDHIIPLQGKLVSGLHVETNLQYLSAKDNLTKNNKFDIQ